MENLQKAQKEGNIVNKIINKIKWTIEYIQLKKGRKRGKMAQRTDEKNRKQITRWKFKPSQIDKYI